MSEARGWAHGERWVRARIYLASGLLAGCFALLGYKAWVLQVREADRMKDMAEDQYLREIELPARRGRILDRNGAELAVSVEVDSIYANPRQVAAGPGTEPVARELAKVLHLDKKDLEKKLRSHRFFSWIKRRVLPEEARAVKALNLTGVYIAQEPRRYYPNRNMAGPVIGWAGMDGRGLEGVELRYDKDLKGAPAEVVGLRDALGREVLPSGIGDSQPQGGRDVVTTIDKFIQYRLEKALAEGVAAHRARAGWAIALDPRTGEILALASVPTVNPNDSQSIAEAQGAAKKDGVRDRPVTDPYEPGSTMKAFTLAAAIELGLTRPDEPWYCENGSFRIGPAVIHDAERIGHVNTTQVLAESSNICTAKIARRVGRERLDAFLRRFGFAAPTGVDLPGERAGLLRSSRRWGEVELATISFGQGMTATQLQIAAGYAALANGGTWYRPHVVRRVLDDKGRTIADFSAEGRRVLDPGAAKIMRQMLHAVTQKGGTGEKLAIPGYPAGGKTGTAQKVDPMTRRYSTDKWLSSFVGFAPRDDARLVIMVTVDEPADTHYGGAVAGPIWREVMLDALRYMNVTPVAEPGLAAMPPPAAPTPAPAVAAPASATPSADAREDAGDIAGLVLAEELGEALEIPDFTGLSVGEALDLARRLRLPVEIVGSGRAVSQSPGPGPAEEGARCRVSFAPPG